MKLSILAKFLFIVVVTASCTNISVPAGSFTSCRQRLQFGQKDSHLTQSGQEMLENVLAAACEPDSLCYEECTRSEFHFGYDLCDGAKIGSQCRECMNHHYFQTYDECLNY